MRLWFINDNDIFKGSVAEILAVDRFIKRSLSRTAKN